MCSGSSCCVCSCYSMSTWLFFTIVFCAVTGCTVWVLWLFVMFVALFCYHLCTWSVPSRISEQAVCWCCAHWLTITGSRGSTKLGASLREDGNTAGFQSCFFFKIYTLEKVQNREILSSIRSCPAVGLPSFQELAHQHCAPCIPDCHCAACRPLITLPTPWEQQLYSWQSIGSGAHRYVKTLFVTLFVEVQFAGGQDVTVAGHQLQQQAGLWFIAVCLRGGLQASVPTLRHLAKHNKADCWHFIPTFQSNLLPSSSHTKLYQIGLWRTGSRVPFPAVAKDFSVFQYPDQLIFMDAKVAGE